MDTLINSSFQVLADCSQYKLFMLNTVPICFALSNILALFSLFKIKSDVTLRWPVTSNFTICCLSKVASPKFQLIFRLPIIKLSITAII